MVEVASHFRSAYLRERRLQSLWAAAFFVLGMGIGLWLARVLG